MGFDDYAFKNIRYSFNPALEENIERVATLRTLNYNPESTYMPINPNLAVFGKDQTGILRGGREMPPGQVSAAHLEYKGKTFRWKPFQGVLDKLSGRVKLDKWDQMMQKRRLDSFIESVKTPATMMEGLFAGNLYMRKPGEVRNQPDFDKKGFQNNVEDVGRSKKFFVDTKRSQLNKVVTDTVFRMRDHEEKNPPNIHFNGKKNIVDKFKVMSTLVGNTGLATNATAIFGSAIGDALPETQNRVVKVVTS